MDQKLKPKSGEESEVTGKAGLRLPSPTPAHAPEVAETGPIEDVPAPEPELESISEEIEDPEIDALHALVGTIFDERYEILAELARGGMGIVFRAQHLTLNRPVVIKVLKANQIGSGTAKARFEREARRACQLDHPNIVTVHDFGYHGDLGYLVMEHVDGMTLSDYLKERGPMSFSQFAPVVAAILSGLAEAHRQNIIHRDIKSSNIMLTFEGKRLRRVKILDFGLAKVEGAVEDDVTKKSNLVGTMGAMPPERILCKPTDCRVDLYALGVCAYRMITGRRPFVGEDMHVLYQHVHEHPPPLNEMLPQNHDYPMVVLEWVHRLLAKDPSDRPRDAQQAREWLLETVVERSVFRIDETVVEWLDSGGVPGIRSSGSFESTNPSWSFTSPSQSFRSVLPGEAGASSSGRPTNNSATTAPSWSSPFGSASAGTHTGSSGASVAPPTSRLGVGIAVGVLGLAIVAGIGATQFLGKDANGEAAVAAKGEAVAPAPTKTQDIEKVFDRVEADLERGAFGNAENLLNSVRDSIRSNTDYQVRAAEYQTRIDIDKHLRRAEQAEKSLNIESAIKSYDAVLSLDAGNEQAKERHEALSSKVVLKVTSNEPGQVFVDGKHVGDTPLEKMIGANMSNVEVRAKGLEPWSTSLIPDGGTRLELSADLEEPERSVRRSVSNRKRKPDNTRKPPTGSDGINDESLMKMD